MTPQTVAVRPIPAIAAVGSIETAPAENAQMPNAAEVITNFAEYIALSNTGGRATCRARTYDRVKRACGSVDGHNGDIAPVQVVSIVSVQTAASSSPGGSNACHLPHPCGPYGFGCRIGTGSPEPKPAKLAPARPRPVLRAGRSRLRGRLAPGAQARLARRLVVGSVRAQ